MSVAVTNSTQAGWQAELELGFVHRPVGTVLKHIRHKGPLRVQRPFYEEEGLPHVYLLHPPGGVVGSDSLNITVTLQSRSQALLTSPGSTKFYRSAGATAYLRQRLIIEQGSSLEWFPQENIIFSGARLNSQTVVELTSDACFMGWELNCLGRPSNSETFEQGRLFSRLQIYRDNKPLLLECQRVHDKRALHATSGLRGFPMQAMFIATPCEQKHLDITREILASNPVDFPIAATLVEGLLIVRALGHQTEMLQQQLIPVWQALRPLLLNRTAIRPRIWAT